MPAQSLQTTAFVLLKRPPAESFQSSTVFSAEHGALFILQRMPKKSSGTATVLDLFDEAALTLESSNQGQSWFVKEVELLRRSSGIGRSYDALRLASAFSALVARNPVDEASRSAVGELLRTAFDAFSTAARPDIVYFKSLYRFARDEGYPLKQQWFSTLPPADRRDVAHLLNRPLVEQSAAPEVVIRLQHRLEEYLRGHTEILIE